MNRKSAIMLEEMLSMNVETVNVDTLATLLNLNKSSIYDYLKSINIFLKAAQITELTLKDSLIVIPKKEKQAIYAAIKQDTYYYAYDNSERLYLIFAYLSVYPVMTMAQVSQKLAVSRNTIIKDIHHLKVQLQQKYATDLNIVSEKRKGIRLRYSSEEIIRHEINEQLQQILMNTNSLFLKTAVLQIYTVNQTLSLPILIQKIKQLHPKQSSPLNYTQIAVTVFVTLNRVASHKNLAADSQQPVLNQQILQLVQADLHQTQLAVPLAEECYLANQLYRLYLQIQQTNDTYNKSELSVMVIHFLSAVDQDLEIETVQDQKLIADLTEHIRSFTQTTNSFIQHVTSFADFYNDYGYVLQSVYRNKQIIEDFLGFKISHSLVLSITVHIASSLYRTSNDRNPVKVQAAVLTTVSYAEAKYIRLQVENIHNLEIIGVYTLKKLDAQARALLQQVDLVICTFNFQLENTFCVQVSPTINIEDIGLVKYHVLATLIKKQKNQKIERHKQDYQLLTASNPFLRLLRPENTIFSSQFLNWETAYLMIGKLLQKHAYIKHSYWTAAINNIVSYGPYIVLRDNLAIAHAQNNHSVLADTIGLVFAQKGIGFDSKNKVQFLLFVALQADDDYLAVINAILNVYDNYNFFETIQDTHKYPFFNMWRQSYESSSARSFKPIFN